MTTAQFCDLSQFQPVNIDWQAYKAWSASGDGVSRVALRSSYGVGYKDQHFDVYRAGALSAGIDILILYHYAYSQYNNPVDEANWQKQVVGDIRGEDMLVLDFEENVIQATAYWAHMWLQTQEANYGGKLPGIYASSAYIQDRLQDTRLARYPLWLANWRFTPDERPPVPAPWTSYEFVQYSDRETSIPGVPGTVDANIFLGVKPQQPQEEQPMMIGLDNSVVSQFFDGDDTAWRCKQTGYTIDHGGLTFYRTFGNSGLCGLTHMGLPTSGPIGVANKPGVVYQRFERVVLVFDETRANDHPPGAAGQFYLGHIDQGPFQDPRMAPLQKQVNDLIDENAALQKQLESGQTIPQDVIDDIKILIGNAQKLQKDAGVV